MIEAGIVIICVVLIIALMFDEFCEYIYCTGECIGMYLKGIFKKGMKWLKYYM